MKLGIALSGGGTRAATFHLGVLNRLARGGLLESISKLSTVSGGSIVTALVFCSNEQRWPTSSQFLEKVYPELQTLLTTTDLFSASAVLASPRQWGHLFSRARLISNLLEKRWGVTGNLLDLPDTPVWLINTVCIETGKNWRFSRAEMGDWKFGHHYAPPFSIAEAVAASAAVPYVIGGLKLALPEEKWYEINPATDQATRAIPRLLKEVTLWDGGAYENLGLEPLHKLDRGMIDCDHVLVSDASGPLSMGRGPSPLAIFKGKLTSPRSFDIAADQIRSLRSRVFVNALKDGTASGALIRMGNSVRDLDLKTGRTRTHVEYARFQEDAASALALHYPTNLARMTPEQFSRIARHGFEVADAVLCYYCPIVAPTYFAWN
ncbi:MAG: patatin-like phospholipase family protein [Acidiferrobacteraceae bacterium]